MTCPDELAHERAVTDGPDAELVTHLERCEDCRRRIATTTRAIELARKIEVPVPRPDQREEMRTAILASTRPAPRARPARRWWLAGAAVVAAAAVTALLIRDPDPAPLGHAHGTVTASADARYLVASSSPDEIVLLIEGTLDVEVSALHPGERFRVLTADGEIEVRGTAFEVEIRHGRLVAVRVRHGLVEVRPIGGVLARLTAGQAWSAPVVETATADTTAPAAPPPPTAAPPRPTPRVPAIVQPSPLPLVQRSPQSVAYDEAWAAMRANDFAKASSAFARVGILDPSGPLAEDASYWYPVALARAKRTEAVTAFRDFLDRYPKSVHHGEASAMLGWLLVDADQRTEAARRFRAALDDPRSEVRDSARAGLDALGIRR